MLRAPLRSIVIGLFLATCACLLIRPFWSHDTWWHIKCGELIVRDHAWPSPDRFTCTVNGQPWLAHSWISECVMYLVNRAMGDFGLQVLDTGARLLFVFLVWRALKHSSIPFAVRLAIIANAAFFCATLEYRPHLVVPIFLTLLATSPNLNHPDRRVPLWTIPFMALWSNVHPSILLGQFYLGICLIQRRLQPASHRNFRDTFVLLFALLAGFVNPYHFRLIHFSLFENRAYGYVTINEWLSPLSQLPESAVDSLVLMTNTAIFAWLLIPVLARTRSKATWVYGLGLCVFAGTPYIAFRFMFLSTIAVLPLLGGAPVTARTGKSSRSLSPPTVGVLAIYFMILIIGKPVYSRDWFELKKATAFLNRVHAYGNIFNDFSFGGRIIYDCYPNLKVFADGRIGPFEKKIFALYDEVFQGPKERALAILDAYHINWVLIQESLQPPWMNRSTGFQEMYRNSGIVILKRTEGRRAVPLVNG